MIADKLTDFATHYAAAWGSQDATSVARHFSERGTLTINGGAPAIGRAAIAASAQSFMTAFPDMTVSMDGLDAHVNRTVFRWTLTGTNTGPGGTGKNVRFSGYEEWTIDADGLIENSLGHYDAAEYERQLQHGAPLAGA
jgi:hypothetical protein